MINPKSRNLINRHYRLALLTVTGLIACLCIIACNKNQDTKPNEIEETLTSGEIKVLVDNTAQPIIEDVLAVFHNVYDRANIIQVNKTENEIVRALLTDSATVAVLPRLLTAEEEEYFKRKKITPKVTHFATDAVALITNGKANDTIIELEEVLKVLKGETSPKIKSLVFDNPNSSTVQYLLKLAGVKAVPSKNIYSLKSNEEVIKYVNNNTGSVGVVGVNWLSQPPRGLTRVVESITVSGCR
jgi:phosphate transport system substrate-binding protein